MATVVYLCSWKYPVIIGRILFFAVSRGPHPYMEHLHALDVIMEEKIYEHVSWSTIRGASVHNQIIERVWVDTWMGFTNTYYELFYFLEEQGIINPDQEEDMWALHFVYLPRINIDLSLFMHQWNRHGLRSEGHMTPLQLFVAKCLTLQNSGQTVITYIFTHADKNNEMCEQDVFSQNFDWNDDASVCVVSVSCPLGDK